MTSVYLLLYICTTFIYKHNFKTMKKLIIFLLMAFASSLFAQTVPTKTTACNCVYPLKNNTCWTTGSKGGQYCINKNGNKTYKSSLKSK